MGEADREEPWLSGGVVVHMRRRSRSREVATEVVAEDKSRGNLEETDGANSFSGRLYCVM